MAKFTSQRLPIKSNSGFTLVEIIAVLLILSIVMAITVSRVVALDSSATEKSLMWAVSELNSRECLTWSKIKISDSGWLNDELLFTGIDYDLGPDYRWGSKTVHGGTIKFRENQISVERVPSTDLKPGSWKMLGGG